MRTEEIQAERAIDLSPHNHAFLNPYNGCAMGLSLIHIFLTFQKKIVSGMMAGGVKG